MSASPPSYTCGTCGRSFAARPIRCKCGARFDRDGLLEVSAKGGALTVGVTRVADSAIDALARIVEELERVGARPDARDVEAFTRLAVQTLELVPGVTERVRR